MVMYEGFGEKKKIYLNLAAGFEPWTSVLQCDALVTATTLSGVPR